MQYTCKWGAIVVDEEVHSEAPNSRRMQCVTSFAIDELVKRYMRATKDGLGEIELITWEGDRAFVLVVDASVDLQKATGHYIRGLVKLIDHAPEAPDTSYDVLSAMAVHGDTGRSDGSWLQR